MPKLLIATNNAGKAAELRTLLAGCGWEIVTPAEAGITLDVREDGATYADNARQKALAGMRASGLGTLADDSGLEIEAMDGEPGVPSARFLGADATYAERFAASERRLAGVPKARRGRPAAAAVAGAQPATGQGSV